MRFYLLILFVFLSTVAVGVLAQTPECGRDADGAVCPNDECCGYYGFCGSTEDFCSTQNGCQSNCHLRSNISDLLNRTTFEFMFSHRNDSSCEGSFYTYDAFMAATSVFGGFGRTGNSTTQKREIAAFLAQTAYATRGWPHEDIYFWGYCHVVEQNDTLPDYCVNGSTNWPCAEGKKYYGRGPIQLRYNTYYGPAGLDLSYPLLSDPDLLENDPVMTFKSALHYWMNYHLQKPSCHAVMTNQWVANSDDVKANRVAGFGLTTNIIDGEIECGHVHDDPRDRTRIGFYKKFCNIFGVPIIDPEPPELNCSNQQPYGPAPVPKIFKE